MDNLPVIAIRFALYADLMVLAGMTVFTLYALTAAERTSTSLISLRPIVLVLALLGLILSGLGLLVLAAAMMGADLFPVDPTHVRMILVETAIGTAWIVRMLALAIVLTAALTLGRFPTAMRIVVLLASSVAVATLVWTGHAGATEGVSGTIHRLSDIVHMLAAAIWVGGIASFAWLLFKPAGQTSSIELAITHRALEQFSRVGALVVGLIVLTGLINSQILIGIDNVGLIARTPYGQLLLAKLALFGLMLALAATNRWRLTPALDAGMTSGNLAAAVIALRKSLIAEGVTVFLILALVAWLGTLEPLGLFE
ncbi:copper homeostasis membrane protein CopD [Novosphingobium sp.]|uniref:copper homeostasis membrane protein CopD n=1 Tax=Novosphingobium sp. TaxID=1874826 RepID=UPI00286B0379|nr:copper homeostasis membrane protein CopD [Novosphingobium sp.]